MEWIEEMNPWWFSERWDRDEITLRKWRSQKIKWIPEWIKVISLESFSLNFVVGPRQVGKTTGLKILIKEVIEKGVEPKKIIYLNCDLITSFEELRRLMSAVLKIQNEGILILDEVTSVENWWKVIKGLIDLGKLQKFSIIASGSSSVSLLRYSEAFAGRRGKGKNVVVLPLSFPKFAKILKMEHGLRLSRAFEMYIQRGGFPRSVNEDESFLEEFIMSVDREISRVDRSPKIARRIIYSIIKKAPSALSFSALGKEVDLNHVTAREYAELLEEMFLLKIAYHRENGKINFRKEKKLFLRDPFIARAFARLYSLEVRKDFLYEWIVQEHLYRKFGEIYYYRNSYEIDAIANGLKVEVKAGKAHRRYPRDVIILGEDDIPRFLMKLEGDSHEDV